MIGPQWGDGLFCPGGSFGNGTAIHLARFDRFPDIKVRIHMISKLVYGKINVKIS